MLQTTNKEAGARQSSGKTPKKVLPSPVKARALNELLIGYDKNIRKYLVQGFLKGFDIMSEGKKACVFPKNLKSAEKMQDIVDIILKKELREGRIAGSFSTPPFSEFVCSPIGLDPKSNKANIE